MDIKHDFSPKCRGCGSSAGSVSTLLSLLCFQLHRDMEFHSTSGMQPELLKATMRCSSLLNSFQQCVHCFEQFDTQRCFLQADFCCFLFVDMIHLSGYVLGLSAPLPKWRLHIFILAVSGFHLKMELLYFVAFSAGISGDDFLLQFGGRRRLVIWQQPCSCDPKLPILLFIFIIMCIIIVSRSPAPSPKT